MTWQLPPCYDVFKADGGLTSIVGTRIFQTVAGETASRPYLVWSITTAVPENTLSCPPSVDDQRVTVSVYAQDQGDARRAIQYAAAAAEESLGYIVFGPWDTYEPSTKLYRYSFDVEVWNDRH